MIAYLLLTHPLRCDVVVQLMCCCFALSMFIRKEKFIALFTQSQPHTITILSCYTDFQLSSLLSYPSFVCLVVEVVGGWYSCMAHLRTQIHRFDSPKPKPSCDACHSLMTQRSSSSEQCCLEPMAMQVQIKLYPLQNWKKLAKQLFAWKWFESKLL